MFRSLRSRSNGTAATLLSVALVASVFVMATRNEGFEETRVDLNEAAIWITSRGSVQRLNTEIDEIEGRITASAGVDVAQVGTEVKAFDAGARSLKGVDLVGSRLGSETKLPKEPAVAVGGPTGMVVDRAEGRVWVTPVASLGTTTFDARSATFDAKGDQPVVAAISQGGTVFVYQAGRREIVGIPVAAPGSSDVERKHPISEGLADPELTVVGETAVVFDRRSGRLVSLRGGSRDISDLGDGIVLQQPGPDAPGVLVGTDDGLFEVPLDGGDLRQIARGAGGGAVAPVRAGGCAYGAWSVRSVYARACDSTLTSLSDKGTPRPQAIGDEIPAGSPLTWRTNRGRAALNETNNGFVLTAYDEDPKVIRSELPEDKKEDGEEATKQDDSRCEPDADVGPPTAGNIQVGTRPGRPVVVRILEHPEAVEADKCDAPMVELGERPPGVELIDDDTAIQVTPHGPADIVVPFSLVGSTGKQSVAAEVRVKVVPESEPNGKPQAADDATVAAIGQTVTHDVLANDRDPEGDSIKLVSVQNKSGGATPIFTADGIVTFEADAVAADVNIAYTVEDEGGLTDQGTLVVRVVAPGRTPPDPRPDQLVVRAGATAVVDVLANDTDEDTARDQLTLASITDSSNKIDAKPDSDRRGKVRITPKPGVTGRIPLTYTVTDGANPASSTLLVRVEPAPAGDSPPVAVRDDLNARPGVPALIDVLANDRDADGDLLAVTNVDVSAAPGMSVELLDLHLLRVIAPQGFEGATRVAYTVSDGEKSSDGVVVVVPYESRVTNQPPVAYDDSVTVRAGQWTSIDVTTNDVDPEGEVLVLDRAIEDPEDETGKAVGTAFVRGNSVRFRPNADARGSMDLIYTVKDPAEPPKSDTGVVKVTVLPPDADNLPPKPGQVLEARVRAGQSTGIPLPLLSMDPDGDVVSILGVSPHNPPLLGAVEVTGEGISYTAEPDSKGPDTFDVEVADPEHDPVPMTIRLVVVGRSAQQLPPVAAPDQFNVRVGSGTRLLDVLANDADPDEQEAPEAAEGRTLTLVTTGFAAPSALPAGSGRLEVDAGEIRYTPPASGDARSREVSFTYTIQDRSGLRSEGLARIRIVSEEAEGDPPIARDDLQAPSLPNKTLTIDLLKNDRDPDDPDFPKGATVELVADDPALQATIKGGLVTLRVGARSTQFAYQVTDADGQSAKALVSVPVVDDLWPVAKPDKVTVAAGKTVLINVLENDENPGGRRQDLRLAGDPVGRSVQGGSAKVVGNKISYTASQGAAGSGGFTYVVANASNHMSVGRAQVTITGVANRPPLLSTPASVTVQAGAPPLALDLAALASDPDDDRLDFALVGQPTAGVDARLVGTRLELSAPASTPAGSSSVQVSASDGNETVTRGISIRLLAEVEKLNPRAVDDINVFTKVDQPVTWEVTGNDVVATGQTAKIVSAGPPSGGRGRVSHNDAEITYTPAEGDRLVRIPYTITDDFTRSDGSVPSGRTSSATLVVTVYSRPGTPGAPLGVRNSRSVTLSWSRPDDNGLPIRGYFVEARGGPGARREPAPGTDFEFGGLNNGTAYQFRVAAWNDEYPNPREQDFGPWSASITPNKRPDQPAPPTARFVKEQNPAAGGTLVVSWTPPNNEGSPITGYRVESSAGGGPWTAGPGETSLVASGLTNGTNYQFRVTATNAEGDSDPSSLGSGDIPAGVPGAPSIVSVTEETPSAATDQGTAIVTFTAGPENGDTTTFEVTAEGGPTVPGATSPARVTGLQGGRAYTFTVKATNKAGSTVSAGVAQTTWGKPSAPTGLTATPGDRQATLAWAPSTITGGGTVTYKVVRNGGVVASGLSGTGYTDGGLQNGVDYTYTVVATGGGNHDSDPSNSATANPFGDPTISGLAAAVSGQTITWSWTGDGNGRPLTGYTVVLDGANVQGGTGTSFSRTFGWGESHTVCVTATNSGGRTGPNPPACQQATTPAPPNPNFTISRGESWNPVNGTCTTSCHRVYVQFQNFPPGSYQHECWGVNYGVPISTADGKSQCAAAPGVSVTIRIYGAGVDVTRTYSMP